MDEPSRPGPGKPLGWATLENETQSVRRRWTGEERPDKG
jgi:hypothetical protein